VSCLVLYIGSHIVYAHPHQCHLQGISWTAKPIQSKPSYLSSGWGQCWLDLSWNTCKRLIGKLTSTRTWAKVKPIVASESTKLHEFVCLVFTISIVSGQIRYITTASYFNRRFSICTPDDRSPRWNLWNILSRKKCFYVQWMQLHFLQVNVSLSFDIVWSSYLFYGDSLTFISHENEEKDARIG